MVLTVLSVFFSGIKYIHDVVQLPPLSELFYHPQNCT